MADEVIKPDNSAEMAALKAEVERLRKSNSEILDDYKKAKEAAKAVPQDVDVNALIAFKQKKEQEELEAKGKYDEAIAKQAQQYRDAEEAKNKRIQELEARQRQLEVEAPAVTALADVVHDPQYVLSRISKEQLAREADGTVVVVDGYNRTPVKNGQCRKCLNGCKKIQDHKAVELLQQRYRLSLFLMIKTHLHLIHSTLQSKLGYTEQILINIICSKTQLQVSI